MSQREKVDILVRLVGARRAAAEARVASGAVGGMGTAAAAAGARSRLGARGVGALATGVSALGRAAKTGAFALGGLGLVVGKIAVDEFRESEKSGAKLRAVIASMGNAANISVGEVEGLSERLSVMAGIDDEEIQGAAQKLLTFGKVSNRAGKGNDIFSQSLRTAVDMSAAFDQSLKTSTIQLGKALSEPAKMATALKRTGTFQNEHIEKLKAMEEAGVPLIDQQKYILAAINAQARGAAAADADPFDKLKVSALNLAETIGGFLTPQLEKGAEWLTKFIGEMQSGTGDGGKFVQSLKGLGAALMPAGRAIRDAAVHLGRFGRWLADNPEQAKKLGTALAVLAGAALGLRVFRRVGAWLGAARAGFRLLRTSALTAKHGVSAAGKFMGGVSRGVRGGASKLRSVMRTILGSAGSSGGAAAANRGAGTFASRLPGGLAQRGPALKDTLKAFGGGLGIVVGIGFALKLRDEVSKAVQDAIGASKQQWEAAMTNVPGATSAWDTVKNLFGGDPSGLGGTPRRAHGDRSFKGGLALVGEQGPELVNLPGGTRIFPNPETRQMLTPMAPAVRPMHVTEPPAGGVPDRPIVIEDRSETVVQVDGRELARTVGSVVRNVGARR